MTGSYARRRRAHLARMDRVNRALSRLDEYEAAQSMPEELQPDVQPPILGREALKSLRSMLEETLHEMKRMWERRN